MSLKIHTAALILLLAAPRPAAGQGNVPAGRERAGAWTIPVSDLGVMNGSGTTFLPGPVTTPATHWRIGYHRMDYLRRGLRGLNIIGLDYGLSSNLEGYARLTGEQIGTVNSLAAYAFGGKLVLPFTLPVAREAAVWFESSSTDEIHESEFFPARVSRFGAIFSPFKNGVVTEVVLGVSSTEKGSHLMAGAGMGVALGHGARLSVDAVTGYGEAWGLHMSGSLSVRVLPHVGLVGGTGYLRAAEASTWMLSAGISVSTADIDFNPGPALRVKEEFKLPSLEDIMKEPSGGDQNE